MAHSSWKVFPHAPEDFHLVFAYALVMVKTNHQAEREMRRRVRMMETKSVLVKWEARDDVLQVELLEPHAQSKAHLIPVREWNRAALEDFASRSLISPNNGRRGLLFRKALEEGKGEIELLISREQLENLKG